jgi:phosphate transport system substrate-binding protein
VTGYVAQSTSAGAITYVESSYARNALLPMAKLLNAAGYYTAPSAGAVAVALTAAQLDPSLIVHVDNVYTNPDPRSYPLSAISYLIIPTSTAAPFTTAKGISLGAFAQYALCQGQRDAAALGYSPLAPNLVQAGLNEIPHIPAPAPRSRPSTRPCARIPPPR